MTEKIILYPNTETGGVIVLFPVLACGLTVEQIAEKDVPQGLPYTIVDIDTIPTDSTFRDAWEYTP
jgi:hypothetical protein